MNTANLGYRICWLELACVWPAQLILQHLLMLRQWSRRMTALSSCAFSQDTFHRIVCELSDMFSIYKSLDIDAASLHL